jgi:KaiC/GvpD/RAD55 family RecA-like ATPase
MAKAKNGPDHGAKLPLAKAPTGIAALDEITQGGLPKGRPTLLCGSAGCGKTLLAVEFLVRGATQYDEPGVLMAFEETAAELAQNVRSLGFDLDELSQRNQLAVDYVRVERSRYISRPGSVSNSPKSSAEIPRCLFMVIPWLPCSVAVAGRQGHARCSRGRR